jgi:hypothetical protein
VLLELVQEPSATTVRAVRRGTHRVDAARAQPVAAWVGTVRGAGERVLDALAVPLPQALLPRPPRALARRKRMEPCSHRKWTRSVRKNHTWQWEGWTPSRYSHCFAIHAQVRLHASRQIASGIFRAARTNHDERTFQPFLRSQAPDCRPVPPPLLVFQMRRQCGDVLLDVCGRRGTTPFPKARRQNRWIGVSSASVGQKRLDDLVFSRVEKWQSSFVLSGSLRPQREPKNSQHCRKPSTQSLGNNRS